MSVTASPNAPASVLALYQTLEQPQRWPQALALLADDLGADHVVLDLPAALSEASPLLTARVDPVHADRFTTHPDYPAVRGLLSQAPAGLAMHGDRVLDARHLARSAFYTDVIVPMGGRHSLLAVSQDERGDPGVLATCRSPRKGAFGEQERLCLQAALPHLETVLRLSHRLALRTTRLWWHEHVLEALPLGVFLLDAHARVCHANPAAQAVLARADTLVLSSTHGLGAMDARAARNLRQAVQAALERAGPATDMRALGTGVRVPRVGGSPSGADADLWVRVVPLARGGAAFDCWAQACVAVFCEGEPAKGVDTGELAEHFGFTPREAALAAALIQGHGLAGAAQALGVGRETVRSQLKGLFHKTGVRRQADLVRMLGTWRRWA